MNSRCLALSITLTLCVSCSAPNDSEHEIKSVLVSLSNATDAEPSGMFHPFAIIHSIRTGNVIQFAQSKPGLLLFDIPIAHFWEEDGKRMKDIFHSDQTVNRLETFLEKWEIEFIDTMYDGRNIEDGSFSGFRSITGDLTLPSSNFGPFVTGVFRECYIEEEPLELRIQYEPNG